MAMVPANNFSMHEPLGRDPTKYREQMRDDAVKEHYKAKLDNKSDSELQGKLRALEADWELSAVFDDVRRNGSDAAERHMKDRSLMLKLCDKMGGIPQDLQDELRRVDNTPLTLHEACRDGHLGLATEHANKALDNGESVDAKDDKGVTALGYAVAANRIAVFKLLLKLGADPDEVDNRGNSALHYAAAYGRSELLEYLADGGMNLSKSNDEGKTPLALATQNRLEETSKFLKSRKAA